MGPVESLLRAAYGVYRERGGAVGHFWDLGGRCCAIGAVQKCGDDERAQASAASLLNRVALTMDPSCSSVGCPAFTFNDRYVPDYGPLPVRNLYRRAIALAQERGL